MVVGCGSEDNCLGTRESEREGGVVLLSAFPSDRMASSPIILSGIELRMALWEVPPVIAIVTPVIVRAIATASRHLSIPLNHSTLSPQPSTTKTPFSPFPTLLLLNPLEFLSTLPYIVYSLVSRRAALSPTPEPISSHLRPLLPIANGRCAQESSLTVHRLQAGMHRIEAMSAPCSAILRHATNTVQWHSRPAVLQKGCQAAARRAGPRSP